MIWGNKEMDWNQLVVVIQSEIDANKTAIPQERIKDIQLYLESGEYGMAFEYLYLEIIERHDCTSYLGFEKAREIALFFSLDDKDECMVDDEFWDKFLKWFEGE